MGKYYYWHNGQFTDEIPWMNPGPAYTKHTYNNFDFYTTNSLNGIWKTGTGRIVQGATLKDAYADLRRLINSERTAKEKATTEALVASKTTAKPTKLLKKIPTTSTTSERSMLSYDGSSQQDAFNQNWNYTGALDAWGRIDGKKLVKGNVASLGDLADVDYSNAVADQKFGEAGKLLAFLNTQGYNVQVDGYAGAQTLAALNDYRARRDAQKAALSAATGPTESALNLTPSADSRQYTNFNPTLVTYFGDGSSYESTKGYGAGVTRPDAVGSGGTTLNDDYTFKTADIKSDGISNWTNLNNSYVAYKANPNQYKGDSNFMKAFDAFVSNAKDNGTENGYLDANGNLNQKAVETALGISGKYFGGDRRRMLAGITGGLSALDDLAVAKSANDYDTYNTFKTAITGANLEGVSLEALDNLDNYVWMGEGDKRKLYFKNNNNYWTTGADGNITLALASYNYDPTTKNGGTMNKINYFLAGGPAPAAAPAQGGEDMQAQIVQLVQAAMSGDEQATQTINQIMQAAQQGDQQATQIAQMIQQVAQQMQGQAQALAQTAKRGAKLAYIHSLKTGCPEGEEAVYTMKNGGVCKACVKKAEMAKCGSKAKKMQEGDEVPEEKCGGKTKKHFFGGFLNLIG